MPPVDGHTPSTKSVKKYEKGWQKVQKPRSILEYEGGFRVLKNLFTNSNKELLMVSTALVLIAGLSFLYMQYIGDYVIDDAYITFRYSNHWANGVGIVWNAGEMPRIEGYSNFLWLALCTIPFKLSIDIVEFSKYLGVFFGIANLYVIYRLSALVYDNRLFSLIPPFLVATVPQYHLWAVSGMETQLYIFLILCSLWSFVYEEKNGKLILATPIMLALLGMTRTEGAVFLVLAVAYRAAKIMYLRGKYLKSEWRMHFLWFFLLAALYGGYFVWRALYYHSLLPNPVYIKTEVGGGIYYTLAFVYHFFPYGLLGLYSVLRSDRHHWENFILASACSLLLLVAFFLNPIMGQHFRFLLPLVPLVFILLQPKLSFLLKELVSRRSSLQKGIILLLVVGIAVYPFWNIVDIKKAAEVNKSLISSVHMPLGVYLAENSPKTSVVALGDAGATPFYSDLRTIDILGLNDRFISRYGFDADYVLSLNPDFIVLKSMSGKYFKGTATIYGRYSDAIYETPVFQTKYELRKVFSYYVSETKSYHLWLFAAKPDA